MLHRTKIRVKEIPNSINRSTLQNKMPVTPLRRMRTTTTMSSSSITTKMTTTSTEMRGELALISNTHAKEGSPNTSRPYPSGPFGPTAPAKLIMSQVSTGQDSLMTIINETSTLLQVPTEALPRSLLTLQDPKEGLTTMIPIKVPDTLHLLATAAIRPLTATIQSIISVEAPRGTPIAIDK
jgi:hypothetical protein